ncbi:hypothetical protein EV122DRAFT_263738 [Schizophyllum commune]
MRCYGTRVHCFKRTDRCAPATLILSLLALVQVCRAAVRDSCSNANSVTVGPHDGRQAPAIHSGQSSARPSILHDRRYNKENPMADSILPNLRANRREDSQFYEV